MAVNIVFSTLTVLLHKTGHDFETLWNTTGGVNDPSLDKHSLDIVEVISGGNFRSAVVDNWTMEQFDSVSVYGMNIFGDVLWETEFNMTDKPSPLSSWLLGGQIIDSSAERGGSQKAIFNDQNYKLRLSPNAGRSWFSVSDVELSYGPLPLIFVPRSSYVPFVDPVILDGPLGCWSLDDLLNVVKIYEDKTGMSVPGCIERCWDNATVAMLVQADKCFCTDIKAATPPTDTPAKCYVNCPNSSDKCGGFFISDYGNAYHVQGSKLPGYLETDVLYRAVRPIIDNVIRIDILDVFEVHTVPMFISRIIVYTTDTTGSMTPTYTVQYNESDCTTADGHMKTVAYDGDKIFHANGTQSEVDILKVRCIELVFSYQVPEAVVELWGPDASSDHAEVPALVIRGKVYTEKEEVEEQVVEEEEEEEEEEGEEEEEEEKKAAAKTTTSTTYISPTTTSSPTTTTTSTTLTTTPPLTTTTTSSTLSTSSTKSSTHSPPPITTSPSTSSEPTTTTSTTTFPTSTSTTPSSTTSNASSATTSTATSSSSASDSTSVQTTKKPACDCPSNKTLPKSNLTTEEMQAWINEMQRSLAVNVSALSSTIRRRTSAGDSRMSAISIGYTGVGILVIIFGSIVFMDSPRLVNDFKKLIKNIKSGLCPRTVENSPKC